MAARRISVFDVHDLIQRFRAGQTVRAVARELGMSRNTVRRYRELAEQEGWLAGPLPDLAAVAAKLERATERSPVAGHSCVESYAEFVEELFAKKVEGTAIHSLIRERGFTGSYSAVRRFLRKLRQTKPDVVLRVEVPPGQEAQVDFGYAGEIPDAETGKLRKAWAFVMTLSHSRHQYVELVRDQSVRTWLRVHRNALEYFGGVPAVIVVDNLKAAITQACWREPEVQRSYRDFATAYGFCIRPCRPRTPRHKGKVESGVHYLKRNCLAGRQFRNLEEANRHVRRWLVETAGQRLHGTLQRRPLELFETVEKPALKPLPPQRFELAVWKEATLHPDCYVVLERSFYSAPHRLAGRKLWVRATSSTVEIFENFTLVATHAAASRPGTRRTVREHLPPHKQAWFDETPEACLQRAADLGPWTHRVVEELLGERAQDRLPTVKSILNLQKRYSRTKLEAACHRAHSFGELRYNTIRKILELGLEGGSLPGWEAPLPQPAALPPRFARDWREFFPGPDETEETCPRQPN